MLFFVTRDAPTKRRTDVTLGLRNGRSARGLRLGPAPAPRGPKTGCTLAKLDAGCSSAWTEPWLRAALWSDAASQVGRTRGGRWEIREIEGRDESRRPPIAWNRRFGVPRACGAGICERLPVGWIVRSIRGMRLAEIYRRAGPVVASGRERPASGRALGRSRSHQSSLDAGSDRLRLMRLVC